MKVLYRWKVKPGREQEFELAWAEVTVAMRQRRRGAQGSVLWRSREDPALFFAVAEWNSEAEWQEARQQESAAPAATTRMRAFGSLLSTEKLDVVREELGATRAAPALPRPERS